MRKLLLILIAFIAIVTFIRAFETPNAEALENNFPRQTVGVHINN